MVGSDRGGGWAPEPGLSELSAGSPCLHSETRDRSGVQSGRKGGRLRLEDGGAGPGAVRGWGESCWVAAVPGLWGMGGKAELWRSGRV